MSFAEFVEGLLELQIFPFQGSEFFFSLIEVMEVFSDKEAPEYFLNDSCLMGKITQIFLIEIFELLFFELLPGIVCSELGLDFDGGGFLAFELFSFEVHFEFGLDFECGLVVALPVLLGLIGTVVVELDGVLEAGL